MVSAAVPMSRVEFRSRNGTPPAQGPRRAGPLTVTGLPEGFGMEGTGTKTTGRISFSARTAEWAGGALGLRGIGSKLHGSLRPVRHTEADEIALHLGRRFNPRTLLRGLAACAAALL